MAGRWTALVAGMVLAGAAWAAAAREQIPWAGGLEAARAAARERNVPLVLVLNMDRERGNEAMLADVYTDPTVHAAAKKCVVTIASMFEHAATDADGRKVCSRFGHVTCDEHRATESFLRTEWLKRGPKDDVESPRHVVCAPDGRVLFERVWTCDATELVQLLDRAVKACEPATLAAWDTPTARLERVADPIPCVRDAALRDLVGAKDPATDAQLLDLVRKSEDRDVARVVLAAFAADPTPTRSEGVRKLLSAPSAPARMHAAAAISAERAKDAFDVLSAAFAKEKQEEVRCVLLRAAAACGGDPAKTRELMLKQAKSAEGVLRAHAVVALAPWAAEDAVVDLLRKWPANDKLPVVVRSAACWTLGLCGRKEVAADVRPAAEEKEETLRRVARASADTLTAGRVAPDYLRLKNWVAWLPVAIPDPK